MHFTNNINAHIDEATADLADRLERETSSIFGNMFNQDYKANRIKATAAHAIGAGVVLAAMIADPNVNKSTVIATGVCGVLGTIGACNDYSIADSMTQDNANLAGRCIGSVIVTSIVGAVAGYFLNTPEED